MKRKKIIILICSITLIFAISILTIYFTSTPSPREYAEKQSGLTIPKGVKLLSFQEDWKNTNGDGYRNIEYKLTNKEVEELRHQCLKKSYKRLPIEENGYNPSFLKRINKGFYKIKFLSKTNPWDCEITILDLNEKRLYIILDIT